MSEWQLVIALLLAWGWGRWKEPLIMAVLTANFVATMTLSADVKMVATVDALSFAVLLMINKRRADIAGALFALMIPAYWVGQFIGAQPWIAYLVADGLCYAQIILVAGHGDNGLRDMGRACGSRLHRGFYRFAPGWNSSPPRHTDLDKG